MERRQALMVLASLALGLAGSGCSTRLPSYRYRMTVEVETPEGVRTGSSVIAVDNFKGMGIPGPEAGGVGANVKGEAVTVDLGTRGVLFALLSSRDNRDLAAGIAMDALLPEPVDRGGDGAAWKNNLRALTQVRGQADVPPPSYPMLVTFGDIRDPRTVREVDPGDLAATFGRGVRLRRIAVEITDDAVTDGIAKLLPWWDAYKNKQLDGERISRSPALAGNLNRLNFRKGYAP